jgi:DNA-binding NarL/FixJ family response regulator
MSGHGVPTADPSATSVSDGTIGLVLAGPHPLTLYGLSQVLQKEPDCSLLAVCKGAEATLNAVRRHCPDVLVLDLDRNGEPTLLRRLQREQERTRVIVLAAASDNEAMSDAMRLGASAVVMKEQSPEALLACIRRIHRGEPPVDPPATEVADLVSRKRPTSVRHVGRRLTPREAEIARLAVRGAPTREIAAHFGLKQGTVKIHLHSIYDKLNVDGRLGLILVARRIGLA